MATAKRTTKSKPAATATKKKPAPRAKAAAPSPKKRPTAPPAKPAAKVTAPAQPAAPISPLTGLPTREKIHLPIKGYGRYNSFQVVELLYGKSTAELKQILEYEEKHQARRMIIDRIHDMLRRAAYK